MQSGTPLKIRGFAQEIHVQSATQREPLGTLRVLNDGRKFRYAKAGSSALVAGTMCVCPTVAAGVLDEHLAATAAVGDYQLTLTVTAGGTLAENQLRDGFLVVNDGTGEGHMYKIASNTALASDGTTVYISLEDPIRVAMTGGTSTQISLVSSPWYGVATTTTEENIPAGVPPIAVTANYYFWIQTGGLATCLETGAWAIGSMLTLSATAGAVSAMNSTLDIDMPVVGLQYGMVGVSGEYRTIWLTLD